MNRRPKAKIFYNGIIHTRSSLHPTAQAMYVEDGIIRAIGMNEDILPLGPKEAGKTDLENRHVFPGLIDAHLHLVSGGLFLQSISLGDADSREAFRRRIQEYTDNLPTGRWVSHGAWDHENWGGPLPDKHWLDDLTPDNPVFISRLDGHTALANSLAMKIAGISAKTPQPEGGHFDVDANGQPTGIFRDNAMKLIEKHIPKPSAAEEEEAVHMAARFLFSQGVTSVHSMSLFDAHDIDLFDRLHAAHKLPIRVHASYPLQEWEALANRIKQKGYGDEWLQVRMLKGFADGSLGSRTAAMLAPYADEPKNDGLLLRPETEMRELMHKAYQHNLQVAVHAIGDRAIRSLLDILAAIIRQEGRRDLRFRIEHAQHIHPDELPRFAKLDAIASMQPIHLRYDGRWFHRAIGSGRLAQAYPLRALADNRTQLAFGSDWFVAPPNPFAGMAMAVTRNLGTAEAPQAFQPEQALAIDQALDAYTVGAAYAAFEERTKGKLEKGFLADFIILNQDLTRVAPEAIEQTRVLRTFVHGEEVWAG